MYSVVETGVKIAWRLLIRSCATLARGLVITTEQPLTRRGSDGSNRLIYALVRAAGEHRQDYDRMPVSYPL